MNDESSLIHQLRIDPDEGETGARPWVALGWLVGLLLLAAAAGGAWWWWRQGQLPQVQILTLRAIEIAAGAQRESVLDASGYVVARRQATVSSEVTGKLRAVLVEEGMRVAEGQVLARLDPTTEEAQLALARAQLSSARSVLAEIEVQLADAERSLRRQRELRERGLNSQAALDAAEAAVSTLGARLAARRSDVVVAERSVALQRQLLEELTVRAPFAGVVIAKAAQPGEMVSPISAGGGFTRTGICTIVDMDSLEIEVDVNEAYIQRVSEGQAATARLDAYPEWRIPAEVIAVVPTADRQKATVRVRVGFLESDRRILPDMGVSVRFLDDEPRSATTAPRTASAVEVPLSAIRREGGRPHAWVLSDDRVERRVVTLGEERRDRVVVTAGLAAGDRVVTNAASLELVENQAVRISEETS